MDGWSANALGTYFHLAVVELDACMQDNKEFRRKGQTAVHVVHNIWGVLRATLRFGSRHTKVSVKASCI